MNLFYNSRNLPTPIVVEGEPPFCMGDVESVKVTLDPEAFHVPITSAQLLVARASRMLGFGITVRLVYIADAMMRKKGEYRVDLTPEAIARIQPSADSAHRFELDLRDAKFTLRSRL